MRNWLGGILHRLGLLTHEDLRKILSRPHPYYGSRTARGVQIKEKPESAGVSGLGSGVERGLGR